MKQQTFSDMEYSNRRKETKRRPPMGIEKMLRMYLLQIWFSLSDKGVEDAICDSYAMRKFMGDQFHAGAGAGRNNSSQILPPDRGKRTGQGIL